MERETEKEGERRKYGAEALSRGDSAQPAKSKMSTISPSEFSFSSKEGTERGGNGEEEEENVGEEEWSWGLALQ
jgi:hypothetical protein